MSGFHHEQEEKPCEYHPEFTMKRIPDGVQCTECQHKIWDIHENRAESGLTKAPPECNCQGCRDKRRIRF